jgi:hypothetical protein
MINGWNYEQILSKALRDSYGKKKFKTIFHNFHLFFNLIRGFDLDFYHKVAFFV